MYEAVTNEHRVEVRGAHPANPAQGAAASFEKSAKERERVGQPPNCRLIREGKACGTNRRYIRMSILGDDRDLSWTIVFFGVISSAFRLSTEAVNKVVLWQRYGYTRVVRERLAIVKVTPELVVSNGDVLAEMTSRHHAFATIAWFALSACCLMLIYRFILPGAHKERLRQRCFRSSAPIGLVCGPVLFLLIAGILPLTPAFLLGALTTIVGLVWVRRRHGSTDT